MSLFVEQLRVLVEELVRSLGYVGIGLTLFFETFFPPIPGEFVLPFAGFLVAQGELLLIGVILAGTLGSSFGTFVIYAIGWRIGEQRVRSLIRRYGWLLLLKERDLDRISLIYERHGPLMVCFGRALPFVRTVVALPAGIERMPLARFLIYSSIGSFVWTTILCSLGMLLGRRWPEILVLIDRYERVVVIMLLVVGVSVIIARIRRA